MHWTDPLNTVPPVPARGPSPGLEVRRLLLRRSAAPYPRRPWACGDALPCTDCCLDGLCWMDLLSHALPVPARGPSPCLTVDPFLYLSASAANLFPCLSKTPPDYRALLQPALGVLALLFVLTLDPSLGRG